MLNIARCEGCTQLFEVPDGRPEPHILRETSGLLSTRKVYLCPGCTIAVRAQGKPPAPEAEAEQEAPADEPGQEAAADGAR